MFLLKFLMKNRRDTVKSVRNVHPSQVYSRCFVLIIMMMKLELSGQEKSDGILFIIILLLL